MQSCKHRPIEKTLITNQKLGQSDLVYWLIDNLLSAERHCPWAAC